LANQVVDLGHRLTIQPQRQGNRPGRVGDLVGRPPHPCVGTAEPDASLDILRCDINLQLGGMWQGPIVACHPSVLLVCGWLARATPFSLLSPSACKHPRGRSIAPDGVPSDPLLRPLFPDPHHAEANQLPNRFLCRFRSTRRRILVDTVQCFP